MLKKVEIEDYRSCLKTSFEPQANLSVLIGPNGSGKTNLLNAILLLKRLSEDDGHYFLEKDEPATAHCMIKATFNIHGKKIILTANVHTYTDENNNDVIVSSDQSWFARDFTGNAKRIKIPLFVARYLGKEEHTIPPRVRIYYGHAIREHGQIMGKLPDLLIDAVNKIAIFLHEMRYYSASQFTNPSNCPVSFEIEKAGARSRGIRLESHSKFLFDLFEEYSKKSANYQQYFDIIGPHGIGLIDEINFNSMRTSSVEYSVRSGGKVRQRKRDKILIIPQFIIGKNELSPNQLSEGTFKTITLLFYLVTEASSILLIEEPEVCVHQGLLSSIIELIRIYSRDEQIMITTHSDFVLDKVSPEDVFKVSSLAKEGTKVHHIPKSMSKREYSALKTFLNSEGNLGEYWRHGALE